MKYTTVLAGILCLFFFRINAQGQLYISGGATVHTAGASTLTLSNCRLTNNGTFNANSGTVFFRGNASYANASINGTGSSSFKNLTINKTANGLRLNQNISVSGDFTLTSGGMELSAGNVNFGTTGSLRNETNANRVFGSGGKLIATATLNAPNFSNPANLGANLTSAQNLGSTTIQRGHAASSPQGASILRYFDISPSNNTALNAMLRVDYFEDELNGNTENTLVFWKSTNAGATWTQHGGAYTRDGVNNWVQSSGIASFSRWTLANTCTTAPLAKCRNAVVVLSSAGNGSVSAAGINNGSIDYCNSGLTLSLSKTSFNCSNVGPNTVTLTATSISGVTSTCTATVTVRDLTKPVAKCKAVTLPLVPGNTLTLLPSQVDNISTDACTTPPLLSVSPNTFTCANNGPNVVTLTVSDASNNNSSCTATVTIDCAGTAPNVSQPTENAAALLSEGLDIFPNPAMDMIQVIIKDRGTESRTISILDYSGKVVFTQQHDAGLSLIRIDLSDYRLTSGLYLLQMRSGHKTQSKKLVLLRD